MSYAKRIKAFFHDRGIHSTTVQFEYYGDSAGRDLASASPSASDAISTEAPESCMVQCPSIEGGGGGADNNAFVSSINEGNMGGGGGGTGERTAADGRQQQQQQQRANGTKTDCSEDQCCGQRRVKSAAAGLASIDGTP